LIFANIFNSSYFKFIFVFTLWYHQVKPCANGRVMSFWHVSWSWCCLFVMFVAVLCQVLVCQSISLVSLLLRLVLSVVRQVFLLMLVFVIGVVERLISFIAFAILEFVFFYIFLFMFLVLICIIGVPGSTFFRLMSIQEGSFVSILAPALFRPIIIRMFYRYLNVLCF